MAAGAASGSRAVAATEGRPPPWRRSTAAPVAARLPGERGDRRIRSPRPMRRRTRSWRANPFSNIHNDTWMTDAYQRTGPLGRSPRRRPRRRRRRRCAARSPSTSAAGSSPSAPRRSPPPQARIIDPDTLATIASLRPAARRPTRRARQTYQNFTGGGYFFLDNRDRIWVPTKTDHIFVLGQSADGQTLSLRARLRPHRRARRGHRADHLGAARLLRADLVRLEDERQGRDARPQDRRDPGEDARRGDRELVRGRPRRRLHRLRQADVPLRGRTATARRGSSGRPRYKNSGDRQAEPGRTPAPARRRRS